MPSRYNIIHALALTIVMCAAVSKNFWHNFIHGGFTQPPQVPVLLFALGCQVGLTLLLLLFLWASTLFRARDEVSAEIPRTPPLKAIKFGAVAFAPICLMAFGLQWIGTTLLDKVLNPISKHKVIMIGKIDLLNGQLIGNDCIAIIWNTLCYPLMAGTGL